MKPAQTTFRDMEERVSHIQSLFETMETRCDRNILLHEFKLLKESLHNLSESLHPGQRMILIRGLSSINTSDAFAQGCIDRATDMIHAS